LIKSGVLHHGWWNLRCHEVARLAAHTHKETGVNIEKICLIDNAILLLVNVICEDLIMKIMKIWSLLVFLGAMLGGVEASADVTTISSLVNADTGTVNVDTGLSFVDYWTFHVGSSSSVVGDTHNLFYGFNTTTGDEYTSLTAGVDLIALNIDALNIGLYSATTLGGTAGNPLVFSPVSFVLNSSGTRLTASLLHAGDYALKISGTAVGVYGGSYNASISVTPVPEPEAWVMLLVGIMLLVMQLHRKNVIQSSMLIAA